MNRNKQLVINMISGFIMYVVNFGISFLLSPYIVRKIGVDAYGFIGLANNFVSYASLITIALNSLAGRFITIKIHEKDIDGANRYFSSVVYANIILTVILSVVFLSMWIFLEQIIRIPSNLFWDVKTLFALLFLNCLFSTASSVFSISTFATNKLYLSSLRQIESNLFRGIFIIAAFALFTPRISYLGVASLFITIYCFLFNIYYTKTLLPELSIQRKKFDLKVVWELMASGVWNLINRLGILLLEGLDLLISNIFISSTAMGSLSLAKTIPNTITAMVATISGVFSPDFTILYAQKKEKELVKSVNQAIKIMGILTNIPIIILIVCGDLFFLLWQPTQDSFQLHILSILTCMNSIVSGGVNCIYNIFTVVNKIKLNSILVVVTGFLNACLVFVLLRTTNLGIYAVAGVSTCLSLLRNLLFTVPYGARCLNLKWYQFYPAVGRTVLFVLVVSLLGYAIRYFWTFQEWSGLFVLSVIVLLLSLFIGGFIILNKEDRKLIFRKINKKAA